MNWGSEFIYFRDGPADFAAPPGQHGARADTNVLAIKFDMLLNPSDMQTGAPIRCTNTACNAVLSHLSVIAPVAPDDPLKKVCFKKISTLVFSTFSLGVFRCTFDKTKL